MGKIKYLLGIIIVFLVFPLLVDKVFAFSKEEEKASAKQAFIEYKAKASKDISYETQSTLYLYSHVYNGDFESTYSNGCLAYWGTSQSHYCNPVIHSGYQGRSLALQGEIFRDFDAVYQDITIPNDIDNLELGFNYKYFLDYFASSYASINIYDNYGNLIYDFVISSSTLTWQSTYFDFGKELTASLLGQTLTIQIYNHNNYYNCSLYVDNFTMLSSVDNSLDGAPWYISPVNGWNINSTKSYDTGDFNGDGNKDIAMMYDYGNSRMGIWVLKSDGASFKESNLWYYNPSWNTSDSKTLLIGKYNTDNYDDIAIVYDYGNGRMGIWLFLSNGTNGFNSPQLAYYNDQWNLNATANRFVADINNDTLQDILMVYDYGNNRMGIWSFIYDGNKFNLNLSYYADEWNLTQTTDRFIGDFDAQNGDDIAMIYDYGNNKIGIWVFKSTGGTTLQLELWSLDNGWDIKNSKIKLVDNFTGYGGDDISMIYDYGNNKIGIWLFSSTGSSFTTSLEYVGTNWDINRIKFAYKGDNNADGLPDLNLLYDRGNNSMAIYSYNWVAGPDSIAQLYYTGIDNWNMNSTLTKLAGDFNGDDNVDLSMLYNYGNNTIGFWNFYYNRP
jgi:hypothetical protein